MRKSDGVARIRLLEAGLLALAACLLPVVLAGCEGGPAFDLPAHEIGGNGMQSSASAGIALPLPEPEVTPAQQRDAALSAFLESRQVSETPGYRDARADLDGDGVDDLLLLLDGPSWCGSGGCTLLVFHNGGEDGYRLVTQTSVTHAPIAVGPQRHNGWHDLLVGVGGGGTQGGTVALQFNGEAYPSNPTLLALLANGGMARAQVLIE
ncbi:hypothetical protein [Lysobacter sp. F6437]|uniref:hypothetical protein n=1 Tax=Lysobacter sp. F6437 TaxID=3459296 RepID=UPI00403DC87C